MEAKNDMDLVCTKQIIPNLYLGSYEDASSLLALQNAGITHILTVASGLNPVFPRQFTYKIIPIGDISDSNIRKYFFTCRKFIRKALEEGGAVLVHCLMGISRSATIVIAYLMMEQNISRDEAFSFVRSKRDRVYPNDGFMRQLQQLENDLHL